MMVDVDRWSQHYSHVCWEIDIKWHLTRWCRCYLTLQFTGNTLHLLSRSL